MCGICGMVGQPDRAALGKMAAAMWHRGPDDDGFYVDHSAGLGFRRLSIIDVAGGHQPLTNEDQSLYLVFNGEIYNHVELRKGLQARGHQFRTSSDGEVILHLYEEKGTALVNDLNGIFAFALWNPREEQMVLARDHHGVKPLYYSNRMGRLTFASELKSMLASGRISRAIDPHAVNQYLQYQVVPPPLSILEDVKQLPPGRVLVHRRGDVRIQSYWTPVKQADQTIRSFEQAKEIALEGLRAAVKRQMMSERPLGVFLSGGVDSSALVALASECVSHKLKTFSVGFTGGPDEALLTEWPWARKVAERYGTDHQEFVLNESMFREAMPHTFAAMDMPTSDAINSYWVSHAAAKNVTVALSGTGGDELFLGYSRDASLLRRFAEGKSIEGLPADYVRRIAGMLGRLPKGKLWPTVEKWLDAVNAHALLDEQFVTPSIMGIFDSTQSRSLLAPTLRELAASGPSAVDFVREDVEPDLSRPGDWLLRLEQRAYLSYVLLRDIDAMSMAHSLEVRVPFLDPEYGEALARIPWEMKFGNGVGKAVLKEALRPLLPDDVLFRPKMGFGLPYPQWMRRSLEPMVRDLLSPFRVRRRDLFDATEVDSLVTRFFGGDDGAWRKVWTLFVMEGWATEVLDAGIVKGGTRAHAA